MGGPQVNGKNRKAVQGFFQIIECLSHDRYIIQHVVTKRKFKLSHDKLRKFESDFHLVPQLLDDEPESDSEIIDDLQ